MSYNKRIIPIDLTETIEHIEKQGWKEFEIPSEHSVDTKIQKSFVRKIEDGEDEHLPCVAYIHVTWSPEETERLAGTAVTIDVFTPVVKSENIDEWFKKHKWAPYDNGSMSGKWRIWTATGAEVALYRLESLRKQVTAEIGWKSKKKTA